MKVAQVSFKVRNIEALSWSDGERNGREGGSREERRGRRWEVEVVAEEQSHSVRMSYMAY